MGWNHGVEGEKESLQNVLRWGCCERLYRLWTLQEHLRGCAEAGIQPRFCSPSLVPCDRAKEGVHFPNLSSAAGSASNSPGLIP